jgi:hypothetical protein
VTVPARSHTRRRGPIAKLCRYRHTRSDAVQETIKAIWEALDVPAGVAKQRGMGVR